MVYMDSISRYKRCPLWEAKGMSETMVFTWKIGVLPSGKEIDLWLGGNLGILFMSFEK